MVEIIYSGEGKLRTFNSSIGRKGVTKPRNRFCRILSSRRFGQIGQGVDFPGSIRGNFALIHAFNIVPFTRSPWVGTFESFIPRTIGINDSVRKRMVRNRLLKENCRALISISNYGKKITRVWNDDWDNNTELEKKIKVVYPSVSEISATPKKQNRNVIEIAFCGNAFAQKGGIVALRLAKLCQEKRVPLVMHLVSSFVDGWTDVSDKGLYKGDLSNINLPNVVNHGELPNWKVIELFKAVDYTFLPSLHDTFGYSVIEGMGVGTPAIGTDICALSETISHGETGFLLGTNNDQYNEIDWLSLSGGVWDRISKGWLGTEEYWQLQNATYNDLTDQAYSLCLGLLESRHMYESLSENSIKKAKSNFCPIKNSVILERIYREALNC